MLHRGRTTPGGGSVRHADTEWVRDEGYGAPAFGGIISGTFMILYGIFLGILNLILGKRGRHAR